MDDIMVIIEIFTAIPLPRTHVNMGMFHEVIDNAPNTSFVIDFKPRPIFAHGVLLTAEMTL